MSNAWHVFGAFVFAYFAVLATAFAGWVTHVVICIKAGAWGFLIAGAAFAPVGVVHGVGHWFGAW